MDINEIHTLSARDLQALNERVAEVNRARDAAVDYAANAPLAAVVSIEVEGDDSERLFTHTRDAEPWGAHGTAVRVVCGPEATHAVALAHLRAIVACLESMSPGHFEKHGTWDATSREMFDDCEVPF